MATTASPRPSLSDLCREVIADLAVDTSAPDVAQILRATRRRIGSRQTIPAQVATQVVAGVAANYFRFYTPRQGWTFTGREQRLNPLDPTDLTWTDALGRVIADAVIPGDRPSESDIATAARRLRTRAIAIHGYDLDQIRVLIPRTPELSCLLAPGTSV